MTESARQQTQRQIVAVLLRILHADANSESFPTEQPLIELGLDSMMAITLLLDLEREFGVTIPDDLLTSESFRTVSSLVEVISSSLHATTVR